MTPPCVPAPTNQHQVRISSSANHRPRLNFKDLHPRTSSLFKLSCDDQPHHVQLRLWRLGRFPALFPEGSSPSFLLFCSSGQVESALRTPPILLRSVAEVALPLSWLPPPRHLAQLLQRFLIRSSSRTPGFDVFFYSGRPTIFPASFISSMDSPQCSISSYSVCPGVRPQLCHVSTFSSTSSFKSSDPRHTKNLPFGKLAPAFKHLKDVFCSHSCLAKLKLQAFRSSLLTNWNGISFFYGDVVRSADSFQFLWPVVPVERWTLKRMVHNPLLTEPCM
ncbi:hypothetical protein CRENBAI_024426 [Crenichthys baileyi]|uniref:Uncharacterized protein n=1 Tax=Crenichthys baileyi TaxID=28760 RepID=A0AAV9QYE3_9TELE